MISHHYRPGIYLSTRIALPFGLYQTLAVTVNAFEHQVATRFRTSNPLKQGRRQKPIPHAPQRKTREHSTSSEVTATSVYRSRGRKIRYWNGFHGSRMTTVPYVPSRSDSGLLAGISRKIAKPGSLALTPLPESLSLDPHRSYSSLSNISSYAPFGSKGFPSTSP